MPTVRLAEEKAQTVREAANRGFERVQYEFFNGTNLAAQTNTVNPVVKELIWVKVWNTTDLTWDEKNQVAALAALDDEAHIRASIEMNNEGKQFLQEAFSGLGLSCLPSMGNFLTVNFRSDAMPVYEALLQKGVIVRPVANYKMPNYLRITIGTPEQNNRLIEALTGVLA